MHVMPTPLTKEIVLIGGGHTHALLLRAWGMDPLPGARLTLINPNPTAPYTGMLPGFVAGHYRLDELEIDLVKLARFAGARLIFGEVTGIDRTSQRLKVIGRPDIAYDFASLDIGATSHMPGIPGFFEHAAPAKPLGDFAQAWRAFLPTAQGAVTVIGGGVAGFELAMAMRHALPDSCDVSIFEATHALPELGESLRNRVIGAARELGVIVKEEAPVARIEADAILLADGTKIPSAFTVGTAGAKPYEWLAQTGLELCDGFVAVDETLRARNDPHIFAAGDCAHLTASPRPKAGVFAVRAAPVLTANLRAAASGRKLSPFRPQGDFLKLISFGRKSAVAAKWGRSGKGGWAWQWKDRIDRRFMAGLSAFPPMKPPSPAIIAEGAADLEDKPLCGGCGSKVAPEVLDEILTNGGHTRDDAAVLPHGAEFQALSTDHLRAFWNDPWLFSRIAACHALGDIWAMGAKPQAALAQVTLPSLSESLQKEWLREIMAAASDLMKSEGAPIAGGHSTMGAELQIGFTVTGLADRPITSSGCKPGDLLLLTRPIGSGTILAGEMQCFASGNEVETLLEVLATPQGDAARLLRDADALTDVTGFGLAGHLARMLDASDVSADINLSEIPMFGHAVELAGAGVKSSIWDANRRSVGGEFRDDPRFSLLFDPQTAGGLLASLPEDLAPEILERTIDLGHDAAIIGQVCTRLDRPLIIH